MRVGLLITTFNRPGYLRQCLASVKAAYIPEGTEMLIVDDASTDQVVLELLQEYGYTFIHKSKNASIKDSLVIGCAFLFGVKNVDVIINLDSDAIVRRDFISVLLDLKRKFPQFLITGFNCLTKNKDGSERHRVTIEGDGYNMKKTVGGINMVFDNIQYLNWIRPALVECLEHGGNWDQRACLNANQKGFDVVCAVPSVVDHIGIESSMGHSAGGEPPDQADDFMSPDGYTWVAGERVEFIKETPANISKEPTLDLHKYVDLYNKYHPVPEKVESVFGVDPYDKKRKKLHLPQITLVGADCVDINRLICAADKSCEGIEFGAVKLFSSLESDDPRVHRIRHLGSKEDYSWFIMKEMVHYIDTDYILIIQHDGYVLNPEAWNPEWLNYDLIGAIWGWYPDDGRTRVGNGGLSLRSKRLMEVVKHDSSIYPMNEDGVNFHKEEDHVICRIFGKYLQDKYGIKFAPEEEAIKFSIEAWRNPDPVYRGQFGFHGGGIIGINK